MVSLKNSFSLRDKHDSAQCDIASSREIEMSKNPKLSNTARSLTRAVLACAESNYLFLFSKTYISMTFRIYVMIFRKNSKIFRKSKNG